MENTLKLRFSSIKDFFKAKESSLTYVMYAPYEDTYEVKFKRLKSVVLLDENNNTLVEATSDFKVNLLKNQKVTVILNKDNSEHADIKVTALAHKAVMPYEPYNQVNTRKLKTHGDNNVDPLKPAEIAAIKRND